MNWKSLRPLVAASLVALLALAACGDDGGDVRQLDNDGGGSSVVESSG
jgi:hypothetical protein